MIMNCSKMKHVVTILCVFFVFYTSYSCNESKRDFIIVRSPDRSIKLNVGLNEKGIPFYFIYFEDSLLIKPSTLGLKTKDVDFSKNLRIESVGEVVSVSQAYLLKSGKKKSIEYEANRRTIAFSTKEGRKMEIVFQLSNDGVAFRYRLLGDTSRYIHVIAEQTAFQLQPGSRSWLSPQTEAGSGWQHGQPSYEQYYYINRKIGMKAPFGEGWVFPALFRTGSYWILISEANVNRNYCGSHLEDSLQNGNYSIAFPQPRERTELDAPLYPEGKLPFETPWRVIIMGKSLAPIVETNLITDLSAPSKIKDDDFVKPGLVSWSWILLKDDSTRYNTQKRFIDFASNMNWRYCLIDAKWDKQIGYDRIQKLAEYAKSKNVGLFLWYNSNGHWNTTPQTPNHILFNAQRRNKEFEKLKKIGIKGIKVDFFGGDGQSFMNYYQDLLMDAAKFELMVNFHGTTVPRGWRRTYPNLMTIEAVRGFEMVTMRQEDADQEAIHCTVLPFVRNVVGPMDFTAVNFSGLPNTIRRTTKGFELALSVVFESGLQHIAETPEGLAAQPSYVVKFLKSLPAAWDDIKFIDGFPGEYAVIARRFKDKWYVAGINGTDRSLELDIDLSVLGIKKYKSIFIGDGEESSSFKREYLDSSKVLLKVKPYGGFVIING